MKKIELAYGKGKIEFSVPKNNLNKFVKFTPPSISASDSKKLFKRKIDDFLKIDESLKHFKNKRVCLIIPDGTRDLPLNEIVDNLKPIIAHTTELFVIVATGTHSPKYAPSVKILEDTKKTIGNYFKGKLSLLIHDSRNHEFKDFGETSHGTPVLVNSAAVGFDSYILVSDVKPHYFAGYSNPLKLVVPGIAAYKTTEHNHSFALHPENHSNLHALHPDKSRRTNKVSNDMLEAFKLFFSDKPVFVAGVVSYHCQPLDFYFEKWDKAIPKLLLTSDANFSFPIKPADLVIIGCGGYPADASLYTAQRALELSMAAFKNSSKIILVAKCEEQVGHPETKKNFLDLLSIPFNELENMLTTKYLLYSHKAFRLKKLQKTVEKLFMVSELEEQFLNIIEVERIVPKQLNDYIHNQIKSNTDIKINIIEDAAKMAAL